MITSEFTGGIGTVVIDRPHKANALTEPMLRDLTAAFDAFAARPELRAVILTGRGRVFSAGADLDAARAGLAVSPEWQRLSARVAAMPCLTIAALNGTAAGGSLGMVMACDLRLAVPDAKFFYPVMRLGFLPRPGDPERMVALIGPSRAKMILMGGQRIAADEALAWGLVDRLVAPEALMQDAAALAGDACGADARHVEAIKSLIG
ncbi:short chain enoyl-CoA hydratase /Enoyl-CoA hydratase [Paracoccus halophilus]|uniref:Enoyl-CoA hydratase n=1 Tax=Paracoccus halophilus TaxID=376733 RepID=A0A099EY48_9RHOB|nr:enoyl-CoA hydratase/isomerase family protein [Paracoccus halophilus]KGJ03370.1 enoyl-CoA hydratase [Paracoccus halophilus]SFA58908.1 short chain enoyl-CoA hydratase /Enoyl-CoA hydratase [Paracoccus halophilus]